MTTYNPTLCLLIRVALTLYALSEWGGELFEDTSKDKLTAATATFGISNRGGRVLKGQPTIGGLMKKTTWSTMTSPKSGRVVLHTFGSGIDTVLAAYRADPPREADKKLQLLTYNDNTSVPGFDTKASLITVDVIKGGTYRFQIGGKNGAEGDIVLTATNFPPGGGISAFLIDVGGNPQYQNRPYGCAFQPCQTATFVLHNSTAKAVKVTPTVIPADLFDVPAPLTMKPGTVAVVRFAGKAGSTPVGGRVSEIVYRFPGKSGTVDISTVESRGFLFLADPAGSSDRLTLAIDDRLKVGNVNESEYFTMRLKNTGADTARGCHVRAITAPFNSPYAQVGFRQFDPATKKPIGKVNQPMDIPPGKVASVKVEFRSQISRRADLEFGLNLAINAQCLNREIPRTDLATTFDVTAAGTSEFTDVATALTPKRSVLVVPKGGTASFDVLATNGKRSLPLLARGRYLYPFSQYNPNAEYTVTACRLTAKGKCIAPAGDALWTPKPGEKAKFRVFVKAPKVDPGFDPKQKRIFLDILGVDDDRPNVFGSVDVAVDRK